MNMARAPKPKPATHASSKPARSKVAVRFSHESEKNESTRPDNQSDPEKQEYESKKVSTRETAFQMQKNIIYAAARKDSKEIAQASVTYIENARDKIRELKLQEQPYDKHLKDFERVYAPLEISVKSLSTVYPTILEDLAVRRSNQVNAASAMVKANPARRQTALKSFSKNARIRVEDVREKEKAATDASRLIKHYKNLLYV
ncbi:hypothetical protein BDZ94DRAFT_1244160 [Collybia nuda]|uniref:Uncharacterized protein n=1 Tax=Collybia nuda TaxID=64659 RepID=A0A9P5YIL1_9AGAR|nr:hypothetical protein BDZ94DRAFT_1244160 [Collybia nuda]